MASSKLLFIGYLLLISACSSISHWGVNPPQQLTALINNHEFEQALQLIDHSASNSPYYAQLQQQRDQVSSQQHNYIKQILRSSEQLQQQHLWPQALTLLNDALDKNPHSSALTAALTKTQDRQQHFIAQQKVRLAKVEAPALQQAQSILEQLLQAEPQQTDYIAIQQQNLLRSQQYLPILMTAVEAAIQQQQWHDAQNLLTAAQQLPLQTDLSALKHAVNKKLQLAAHQQQQQALQQQQLITTQLTQSLDKLIQLQQWPEIQAIISTLAQQDSLSDQELDRLSKAKLALSQHLEQIIELGQQHYIKGELQQSIRYWLEALQLAPDNDNIKQRLERAMRFKQNIDKLP
ncbi:hypothetical protein [Dasania marina]|uniref:hypothetical protein n=1 Tax=Dasania marina TaxID=471499 RepID=UPI0030DC781F|tara:strand:+ start:2837 stop:3880 length:1044 start_codon:yes stop_codon:yes gene_type:complete